jgi:hypothetical protein
LNKLLLTLIIDSALWTEEVVTASVSASEEVVAPVSEEVVDPLEGMALSNYQGAFLAISFVLLTPPDLVVSLPGLFHAFPWYYFLHRSCAHWPVL